MGWPLGKEKDRPVAASVDLEVIRESAAEVVPAVLTAVTTTIVSFLPVFFLTGRDHRLFAPLAWTKTFALASSLIVAVAVVPMLCRIFLKSSQARWLSSLAAGLGFASIERGALLFRVGRTHRLNGLPLGLPAATAASAVIGMAVGWWMSGEKIRPIEGNPVSRVVLWLYSGRLKLALRRKALMLSFPALIMVIGLGAWIGLPTVLRPVERVAARFWCGSE